MKYNLIVNIFLKGMLRLDQKMQQQVDEKTRQVDRCQSLQQPVS